MKIKLIAFDLDGTLLRSDKTVSERSKRALSQAAETGIHIVATTGRTCEGMPEEVQKLPFLRYVAATNGALIYDRKEQKVLYRAELDREKSVRMLTYMENLPALRTCYQNGKGWIEASDREKIEEYAPYPEQIPFMKQIFTPIDHMKERIFDYGSSIQKLQLFFKNRDARDPVLEDMRKRFPEYAISCALPNNIEVNALEANKGNALKFLCDYLGISPLESMAFGDGLNDITMIRQAGVGVAMGNAEPEVLEAADWVALSNDEDGIAVIVEEMLERPRNA